MDQLPPDIDSLREAILSGDPSLTMPSLVKLRDIPVDQAVPLLLLALKDSTFLVRSLGCAGLGVKRNEAGWEALVKVLQQDGDANVRAEASNSLVNFGVERAWPLLKASFAADDQWLVRCSILSALAEQAEMPQEWLLELAQMAITATDGTVRTGGAEILGRLWGEKVEAARPILVSLQADPDHRVAAAALNGLQK